MKKIIWIKWVVLIIILVAVITLLTLSNTTKDREVITVGAILPLTGPTAIWGESLKEGMEIALEEINSEKEKIKLVYEDSQGISSGAVSAWQKLQNTDNPDVIISALSASSIPLIPLAEKDKTSLLMTVVSAENFPLNDYTTRFFPTASQISAKLAGVLQEKEYNNIGIVYRNDEYGVSFLKNISENAGLNGKTKEYAFKQFESDFRTTIQKIKSDKIDAVVFVAVSPSELTAFVKQSYSNNLTVDFYEAANQLTVSDYRKSLSGQEIEGKCTLAYDFLLNDSEVKTKYIQKYNKEPNWAVPFGYDSLKLILNSDKVKEGKTVKTLNGDIRITDIREINPKMNLVCINDGVLR